MELELGCIVWFFDGEKIVKGIFNDKFYKPKPLGFNVDVPIVSFNVISKELVDGEVKTRYYACLPEDLFESREALCEHYRKIFK